MRLGKWERDRCLVVALEMFAMTGAAFVLVPRRLCASEIMKGACS